MKVTRDDIIREVAIKVDQPKNVVRSIYEEMWNVITQQFAKATEGDDVVINFTKGITAKAVHSNPKEMINYLSPNREKTMTKETIKPKFKFSKGYCERLVNAE